MRKAKFSGFQVPLELLKKAHAKAWSQRRSLNNYLTVLVARDVGEMPAAVKAEANGKAKTKK